MSASKLSMRMLRSVLSSLLDLVETSLGIPKQDRKSSMAAVYSMPGGRKIKQSAYEDVFPNAVPANDFLYDATKNDPVVTIELPTEAYSLAFAGVAKGFIFREKYNLPEMFRKHTKIDFVFKDRENEPVNMSTLFVRGVMVDYLDKFYDVSYGEQPRITFNGKVQAPSLVDPDMRDIKNTEHYHILVNLKRRKIRGLPLE